jgi:hypothetical protein
MANFDGGKCGEIVVCVLAKAKVRKNLVIANAK